MKSVSKRPSKQTSRWSSSYAFATLSAAILSATVSAVPLETASAEDHSGEKRHHALYLIDPPKYPADFKHFKFVNPNAPKGGKVRMADIGAFDSLNILNFKGVKPAALSLVYESLMQDSLDEESTSYGLIAEWVSYPDDYSSVTYKLRDEAKWHDGKPITVEDVIFSLEMAKKVHPHYAYYYKNISSAEQTGDRQVTFSFDIKNNRELPMITGQFPIVPKHYWTGKDKDGKTRDISKTTLEIPLGSGPYKIKTSKSSRYIVYERVENYWGKNLPVNTGFYNFDEIRFEVYRDQTVALEAFKADKLDYREENNSKLWATSYNFPAVKKGKVKTEEIALKTGKPMQGFAFNLRRDKFKDRRVREAIGLAFDFEWSNKNLFYGQYKRTSSYFENRDIAAKGLPEGLELEILNNLKGDIPPEVFTKEFVPASGGKNMRTNFRKALKLLREAGWKIAKEGKPILRNANGKAFELEFLMVSPAFERIIQPYLRNLERLGIQGKIRLVDVSEYKRRLDTFDFDMITHVVAQSGSPGNEQRNYWGSESAEKKGSRNVMGIKNPAIDKLVDRVIFAKDRAELVAATKALDRVLLWNHYVVLTWHSPKERLAYWKRFAHPETLPSQQVGFLSVWWYDQEAADKL